MGEVKVYNTIISDAAQLLRGATQAFGATRARLLAENLGEFAPKDYRRTCVVAPRSDGVPRTAKYQTALDRRSRAGRRTTCSCSSARSGAASRRRRCASWATRASAGAERRHRHRAREHDVVDVDVLHLLPRPAALAGGAVGDRDRDREGDQEERELLDVECARRTRYSSTGTPCGMLNSGRIWVLTKPQTKADISRVSVCAACRVPRQYH